MRSLRRGGERGARRLTRGALGLCLPFVVCSLPAAFEARVVLPDGSPVADATISILGRSGSARTNGLGVFTWEPDPPVPFDLLVVMPDGHHAAPVTVKEIPPQATLTITVAPFSTESVEVTAEAAPHIEAPPASAVTLLAREDLERRHSPRLAGALENIPGVGRLGQGHDAVPSIRGLARGRTLLLIDGARVTSERRAGPSASFLDPFFLEAIEVARGPGSVAYGSDALGGIILARTRRAAPGSPLGIRFTGSLGSGVPQAGAGVEVSRGLNEGGLIFQARYRDLGDYWSPSGDIGNSSASDYGLFGRFDHEAGAGVFTAALQSDSGRGVERPASDSDVTSVSNPREDSRRLTLSYLMDPLPSGLSIDLSGFAGTYRLVTRQDRAPSASSAGGISESDIRARDFGVRARAVKPLDRARLELGADVNGRLDLESTVVEPDVRETSIEDADRADAALYVTGEVAPARALATSGGLRFDRITTHNSGGTFGSASTSHAALSGFVALNAGPFRGLTLTGQVSRGFRDPTLSDRYFTGITGRGFVTGDPDLEPEVSLQFDVSARYTGGALRCALYAYHYRIEDLIERFQTGVDPATGRDLFSFRNRGSATLHGVELEVHAGLGRGLRLELGAQTSRGETEEGESLDDIPVQDVTLLLRKELGGRGDLMVRAGWYGRDDRPGPTEIVTPGYGTIDLAGGWIATSHIEVRLLLGNIFNQEYPGSPDEKAVAAPGRSVLLTVAASMGG